MAPSCGFSLFVEAFRMFIRRPHFAPEVCDPGHIIQMDGRKTGSGRPHAGSDRAVAGAFIRIIRMWRQFRGAYVTILISG